MHTHNSHYVPYTKASPRAHPSPSRSRSPFCACRWMRTAWVRRASEGFSRRDPSPLRVLLLRAPAASPQDQAA